MGYVHGFDLETRQRLEQIAAEQGLLASVVRPTTWAGLDGWEVPDSVSDAYADTLSKPAPAAKKAAKKQPEPVVEAAPEPESVSTDTDTQE